MKVLEKSFDKSKVVRKRCMFCERDADRVDRYQPALPASGGERGARVPIREQVHSSQMTSPRLESFWPPQPKSSQQTFMKTSSLKTGGTQMGKAEAGPCFRAVGRQTCKRILQTQVTEIDRPS